MNTRDEVLDALQRMGDEPLPEGTEIVIAQSEIDRLHAKKGAPTARRPRKKKYRATHAVQLYGPTSKDHSDYGAAGEFSGADNGFRCYHLLKVGTKWVHLVEIATQTLRKCEISIWNKLVRKGWQLDKKGRRVSAAAE